MNDRNTRKMAADAFEQMHDLATGDEKTMRVSELL
jgi:hypothetical protein